MKQFNVYANRQETYEAVKRGWSWPAFFLPFLWAIVNRMLVLGFLVLLCDFFVVRVLLPAGESVQQTRTTTNIGGLVLLTKIGLLVLRFVFGAFGNLWKAKKLKSRGFDFKDTVSAEDDEAACWIVRRRVEEALKDASDIRADDS